MKEKQININSKNFSKNNYLCIRCSKTTKIHKLMECLLFFDQTTTIEAKEQTRLSK